MAFNEKDRQEIRLYLLGRLEPERRAQRVEERMLTEPDYYEELLIAEDEVIDQYLSRALSPDERAGFEQHFLRVPERTNKLRFARAFRDYVSAAPEVERAPTPVSGRLWTVFRPLFAAPARAAAATALVLICCSLLVWWAFVSSDSETSRGLAALREVYGGKRPVEARITGFAYAPWSVTRGGSPPKVDATARDRAERLLLDAVHEHPSPASRHALGQFYLAEHKYEQAIALLDEALKADRNNAQLHNDLGVAFFEQGRDERADAGAGKDIEALARSVEQFNRAIELDHSLSEAHFNRALAYQHMMLWQQAEESWREYLQRDANSPWADEARRNLKLLEEKRDATSQNNADALREFLDARRAGNDDAAWKVVSQNYTSAGNGVTNGLLDSLFELEPAGPSVATGDAVLPALSHLARLELNRAGDRYTSDLVSWYERATPELQPLLADAHRHMKAGYALFTQSKFTEAIGEYTKAKMTYERADDDVERAFAEYRLAHCYVFLPDSQKARSAFEQLSAVCEAREYRWLLAHCLYGLAHLSADNSEYTKAIDYSSLALTAFERAGDLNGILKCLTQLADAHQVLNRVGHSLGYLRRGLDLADEIPAEPIERWGILVQTAFSLSSLQLHAAALSYQKEALSLALKTERPLIISRSDGYVGSAYAAMKIYPEALSHATRAFETGRSLPENSGGVEIMANASHQIGDILRQSGECGKAVEAYDRSIRLYGDLNFEYYSYAAHKGKLLCFIDGPDDLAVGDELQTVLGLFERYRSKITAESQRNSFFDKEQSVYDLAINYEFARMADPVRAFEYSEVSRARSLLDAVRQGAELSKQGHGPDLDLPTVTSPMSLAEVQAGMPEGAQILQYAVLEDRLLIWVVTKSGVHYGEAGVGSQTLTEKVRAYLAAVSAPPTAYAANQTVSAEDLYQILVAPVEPYLDQAKFLCVVPDKILHYLPYAALVSPATARYLMEDYNIGIAPSSTIFVSVSATAGRRAEAFAERLLSVGDPRFSRAAFPSLPALPSAAREAEAVSAFYRTRRLLLREEAAEQSVKSEIEQADIVHLALHYVVNGGSEMLSGFALAPGQAPVGGRERPDGFLQFHEIYRMKLPRTRLVVLSACQTGIEQKYDGEGAIGVTRPFLVAGVPVVVASLWPIDSEASADLMINFHRHRIHHALPASQALRQAQIEMARGPNARYRHPYYWAPFVAVGGHSPF